MDLGSDKSIETSRKKIEFSGEIGICSPDKIIDSLCDSDEEETDQDSLGSGITPVGSNSDGIVELCSPAHLHGLLQLSTDHGTPFFEFSVKSPAETIVAKAWKDKNTFNWIYTFHRRKHGNAIGQMNVSCYTPSKLKPSVASTMLTEFTLYDTVKEKLHPGLEIAAIVVRAPHCNRESLKCTKIDLSWRRKLMDFYRMEEQGDGANLESRNVGKVVQAVVPFGRHSLPSDKRCGGPSPLLHRWRFGGGCDCGGWDMACPLAVFSNLNFRVAEDVSLMDNRLPVVLFQEGRKDDLPAFAMRAVGEGKYTVDFHAQLSSLQASSISLALLHAAESSTPACHMPSLPPQKKIGTFLDNIMEEPKFEHQNLVGSVKPFSFVLNPPFSPTARM